MIKFSLCCGFIEFKVCVSFFWELFQVYKRISWFTVELAGVYCQCTAIFLQAGFLQSFESLKKLWNI